LITCPPCARIFAPLVSDQTAPGTINDTARADEIKDEKSAKVRASFMVFGGDSFPKAPPRKPISSSRSLRPARGSWQYRELPKTSDVEVRIEEFEFPLISGE
jgi:hypothetical protein